MSLIDNMKPMNLSVLSFDELRLLGKGYSEEIKNGLIGNSPSVDVIELYSIRLVELIKEMKTRDKDLKARDLRILSEMFEKKGFKND